MALGSNDLSTLPLKGDLLLFVHCMFEEKNFSKLTQTDTHVLSEKCPCALFCVGLVSEIISLCLPFVFLESEGAVFTRVSDVYGRSLQDFESAS